MLLGFVPATIAALAVTVYGKAWVAPAAFCAYQFLILTFTAIYRVSAIHPLAKYPGPLLSKLSKFRTVQLVSKGALHHYYYELHRQHGDVVRVGTHYINHQPHKYLKQFSGPNELSYCNFDGLSCILSGRGLPKGPCEFTLMFDNHVSSNLHSDWTGPKVPDLATIRDPAEHARRRIPWDRAFSGTALKDYEPIFIKRCYELVKALGKRQSEVVDISKWMEYFA